MNYKTDLSKQNQNLLINADVKVEDKIYSKIQKLLKETNRTESIKQRLNKFKSLFKNIDIMTKFDKDVFECLIDKVIIGEIQEDQTVIPYTIRFICKNGSEII